MRTRALVGSSSLCRGTRCAFLALGAVLLAHAGRELLVVNSHTWNARSPGRPCYGRCDRQCSRFLGGAVGRSGRAAEVKALASKSNQQLPWAAETRPWEEAEPGLMQVIKQHWGHDRLRPHQREVLQAALEGRDVIAVLQTGYGKSLCYQAPALLRLRIGRGTLSHYRGDALCMRVMSASGTELLGTDPCNCPGHGHGHGQTRGHAHSQALISESQEESQERATHLSTGVESFRLADSVGWLSVHDLAECTSPAHNQTNGEEVRWDGSILNTSSNVLVVVRAKELVTMGNVNTFLAVVSLLYMSVNVVCFVLNTYDNDCDPRSSGCDPATSLDVFHRLEFWATFVFNTVDLFALSYSPRTLSNQYRSPGLLKLLVLLDVCMAFTAALLVTINREKFEVASHELEYANELIITIFDAAILISLVRGRSHRATICKSDQCVSAVSLLAALLVALVQLGVYNLRGWTSDGDSRGESTAHYLEFAFGFASGCITFWFTMDNKMCTEKRLRQLMYGATQS